jgi:hypothetical protein
VIAYASNTGSRRNLAALRAHGWRILLTPSNPLSREGLKFGIDNGAWTAFQQRKPFDGVAFQRLIEHHGASADFVVIPDIVAGGMASLDFSLAWIPKMRCLKLILLPVQDGMDLRSVTQVLWRYANMGLFLGGTTEWKLKTMHQWGTLAAAMNRHYHIGRVNTRRRIRLAAEAGASSFDGTSATMFSCTLPLLESARQQPNLFAPTRSLC